MMDQYKELLIKDLSARLLYNPWVQFNLRFGDNGHQEGLFKAHISELSPEGWISVDYLDGKNETWEREWSGCIEDIKPYLRPMSSITDDEIRDLQKITWQFCFSRYDNSAYVGAADDGFCSVLEMEQILSYLNSHHFDYRCLIEKGLALEAPEGMYEV